MNAKLFVSSKSLVKRDTNALFPEDSFGCSLYPNHLLGVVESLRELEESYSVYFMGAAKKIYSEVFKLTESWCSMYEFICDLPDNFVGQSVLFPVYNAYAIMYHKEESDLAFEVEVDGNKVKSVDESGRLYIIPPKMKVAVNHVSGKHLNMCHILISRDLFRGVIKKYGGMDSASFDLGVYVGRGNDIACHLVSALCESLPALGEKALNIIGGALFTHLSQERASLPEKQQGKKLSSADLKKIESVMLGQIETGLEIDVIANQFGMTTHVFSKCFRSSFNTTLLQYFNQLRMTLAKKYVEEGAASLTKVAIDLGFFDSAHFSKAFSKYWGVPPSRLRRKSI